MTELAVIDMEANSHLLSFNDLVGDARVAWVELKSLALQTIAKLATVKWACHHCSINGVLALCE